MKKGLMITYKIRWYSDKSLFFIKRFYVSSPMIQREFITGIDMPKTYSDFMSLHLNVKSYARKQRVKYDKKFHSISSLEILSVLELEYDGKPQLIDLSEVLGKGGVS